MPKYKKLHNVKWLRKTLKVRTLRSIASDIGCSYSAVQYARRKYNINIPHRDKYTVTERKSIAQKEAYRKKYPNGRFGNLHPGWKGGRRRLKDGYIYVYKPDHPYCTKARYVMEHRLVMEEKIGRYLLPREIIHHENGNKQDNRPENLHLHSSRAKHVQYHFDAVKEVYRLRKILDDHQINY